MRARAAGDLPVGHVAHQHVRERVLGFVGHRRAALAADELLTLQLVQALVQLTAGGPGAERGDRAGPEDLPDHGGVMQQPLLRRRQQVQPGADDALDRFRQRQLRPARRSASICTYCSAYSGLPPARASSPACCPASSTGRPSSKPISRAVSWSDNGASDKVRAFGLPPPQPGRRSSSSGRADPATSNGTPPAQPTR